MCFLQKTAATLLLPPTIGGLTPSTVMRKIGSTFDIGVTGSWAVYGFKNDKPASFDTFKVLILGTESWNLKEFELLAGNDSATGKFESIGKLQTQNIRFFKEPYQEFRFPPVKARYLKVKIISSHGFSSVGVYEFQLLGALE